MEPIFETAFRVTAHIFDKKFFDDFWYNNNINDLEWDLYRNKPMPTIEDLNTFPPSALRSFCKCIIQHNIRDEVVRPIRHVR